MLSVFMRLEVFVENKVGFNLEQKKKKSNLSSTV